mgnify:FL=1
MPVLQRIAAGEIPQSHQAGTASRIFTGALMPAGADAVLLQEDAENLKQSLRCLEAVTRGQHVRRAGDDIVCGNTILSEGQRLRPVDIGLLASVGIAEVSVYRPLRVALLSTGSELLAPGEPYQMAKVYNSNRFMLRDMLNCLGVEVIDCGHIQDDPKATREQLVAAAEQADCVITTGGMSVGEEDHVRAVLEESGSLSLWKMAIKPGKPVAFGAIGGTPVLGLPGNPGSVLVTFLMVGMPYIRKRQGRNPKPLSGERIPADFTIDSPSIRREFVRARKESRGSEPVVAAYPNQSSGILSSTCWADGLAVVPENSTVSPGDLLTYYSFAELLS